MKLEPTARRTPEEWLAIAQRDAGAPTVAAAETHEAPQGDELATD